MFGFSRALVTTRRTLVRQRMVLRYELRYRRNDAVAQTTAADNQIAQAIQQPVVNFVLRASVHTNTLGVECLFWHSKAGMTSEKDNISQFC